MPTSRDSSSAGRTSSSPTVSTAVKRMPYERALHASTTHRHDYLRAYVRDLGAVLDLDAVRSAGLKLAVDPLGGAGVRYWGAIAEQYGLNLTVTNQHVDPTFRFMDVDWDGRIRMDPSSPYAMQSLDRSQGSVRRRVRLRYRSRPPWRRDEKRGTAARRITISPCACTICSRTVPAWTAECAVGKTVVSSSLIDRVAAKLGRRTVRSAGRLQVVRGRTVSRLARIRRRGERRRVVVAPRWLRVDHRQGRDRRGVAGGGDDREDRARPR